MNVIPVEAAGTPGVNVIPVDLELPDAIAPIFQPRRFKVLYGGRDGAKSWSVARILILKATKGPVRVGCFREVQKSIKESVHALLKAQIAALGLSHLFEVLETEIRGPHGSQFLFAGLRNQTVENLKSFEGLDIAWVEEARNVTKRSWDVLIPTIRKPGSEIWISFNPELDTDETYVRFVTRADADVMLLPMSWRDNPWRSEVLDSDRIRMQRDDPDGYLTIYEGKCRQYLDGAIYARELREATADGRITAVPYEDLRPVHTFWDLGWSDASAIWLIQSVGFEYRVIGYIEGTARKLSDYVRDLEALPYVWGTDWLPHDARARTLASGGMSVADLLTQAGRRVAVAPQLSIADGINAARTIFPRCWFDAERCREGLNRLRRYAYEVDENGQRSKLPLHDDNSHGADAFRTFAVASSHVARKRSTVKTVDLEVA